MDDDSGPKSRSTQTSHGSTNHARLCVFLNDKKVRLCYPSAQVMRICAAKFRLLSVSISH
jgi:hypothetical protein